MFKLLDVLFGSTKFFPTHLPRVHAWWMNAYDCKWWAMLPWSWWFTNGRYYKSFKKDWFYADGEDRWAILGANLYHFFTCTCHDQLEYAGPPELPEPLSPGKLRYERIFWAEMARRALAGEEPREFTKEDYLRLRDEDSHRRAEQFRQEVSA